MRAFNDAERQIFLALLQMNIDGGADPLQGECLSYPDYMVSEWLLKRKGAKIPTDMVADSFTEWDNEDAFFGYCTYTDRVNFVITDFRKLRMHLDKAVRATVKNRSAVVTKLAYNEDEYRAEKSRIYDLAELEGWSTRTTSAYLAHLSRRRTQAA